MPSIDLFKRLLFFRQRQTSEVSKTADNYSRKVNIKTLTGNPQAQQQQFIGKCFSENSRKLRQFKRGKKLALWPPRKADFLQDVFLQIAPPPYSHFMVTATAQIKRHIFRQPKSSFHVDKLRSQSIHLSFCQFNMTPNFALYVQ